MRFLADCLHVVLLMLPQLPKNCLRVCGAEKIDGSRHGEQAPVLRHALVGKGKDAKRRRSERLSRMHGSEDRLTNRLTNKE